MNLNVKNLSAESFKKGEEILKAQLNNNYKIVNVDSKRKWLIGPRYCEISYIDLSNSMVDSVGGSSNSNEVKAPLNAEMFLSEKSGFASESDLKEMASEMSEMKDMFESLIKEVNVALQKAERNSNDALTQVEDALVKNGVARDIAQQIIKETVELLPKRQKTASKNTILFALKDVLEKSINTCEGYDLNSVKTIMLVGPTGVGKTTTLAKLASILYAKQKEVGLITLDTYRMGAAQQLKEYGNILDFEVEACNDYDELEASLLKFMDKDSILIDTTGQNQKQIVVDDELRSMVDLVNPDQLSLVLSATTKTEDLYDCIDKFSSLDVNSIIVTKIDETNTLGEIINIAYKYPKIKMAYFTNGQDVPADIESAKSEKIIKSIINAD